MVDTTLDISNMLEVRMAYDAERQKVLAQNIANIDTPGYNAKDLVPLDFHNVLKSETQKISMTVTSDMHMNGMNAFSQRFRSETNRDPFEITPTGGSVVVEEQMMKVAQNASDYQMSTNLYRKVGNLFLEAMSLQPPS